ncbi:MAG: CHC2 zinc finger domain-containing protein, partial [bacterium]
MIPQHIVEQVQSSSDIVDVISSHIPLKRAGRSFKACCPFHSEKTPSFLVSPEKQIGHCFGCGAGGSVFNFIALYERVSFP